MKQKEDQDTISFHVSKKLSGKFDEWIGKRMIVRERLWEMILEDLIAGVLYDIPERFKPKINVHIIENKTDKVIKTIDIQLRERMGHGRPDKGLPGSDETKG